MFLDQIEGECRMRGMAMREPSVLSCLTHWTIERQMSIEPRVLVKGASSLGEFAEIVQIRGQGYPTGLLH